MKITYLSSRQLREKVGQLQEENNRLKADLKELRSLHDAGCKEAYRILGEEDDGEYRWKWVLLGLSSLKERFDRLKKELKNDSNNCGGS